LTQIEIIQNQIVDGLLLKRIMPTITKENLAHNIYVMLYHCFKELKPDYKTIIVSVTEIEKALVPTPPFVGELEPKKKANTYWV
jgi:hypothetical protein